MDQHHRPEQHLKMCWQILMEKFQDINYDETDPLPI